MNSFAVSVSPFSHVWRVLYEMATSLARLFCLILLVVGRCCRVPSDIRNVQECRSISGSILRASSPSRLVLPLPSSWLDAVTMCLWKLDEGIVPTLD